MSDIRDLIYVNLDMDVKRVISHGIEFKEFIQALSRRPKNILVLEGNYGTSFDFTTNCEYCVGNDIEEFIKEDVYSYGNFSWVDFDSIESLRSLTPQEVAELLYLDKMWKAVNSTYFEKLSNRFAYVAHDDGWINHTYYNQIEEFQEVLCNVINNKIFNLYNI